MRIARSKPREYTLIPYFWKVKARGSRVQDYPQPHSKFKTNLGNNTLCLKNKYQARRGRYTLYPSTQETKAGRSVDSRPAWSTKRVSGQPELHSETLIQKSKTKEDCADLALELSSHARQ